jgi:hypothetical protein
VQGLRSDPRGSQRLLRRPGTPRVRAVLRYVAIILERRADSSSPTPPVCGRVNTLYQQRSARQVRTPRGQGESGDEARVSAVCPRRVLLVRRRTAPPRVY